MDILNYEEMKNHDSNDGSNNINNNETRYVCP